MFKFNIQRLLFFALFSLCLNWTWAQSQTPLDIALRYAEQQKEAWKLTPADLQDMAVTDQYQSKHNQVTHIFFVQRHNGIPIFNATMGIHVKNGAVVYATNRFISEFNTKVAQTSPVLSAYEGIEKAAGHLNLEIIDPPALKENKGNHSLQYTGGNIANSDMEVTLNFLLKENEEKARLVWNITLDQVNTPDYWNIRVDAITGEFVEKNNWTVYCTFHNEEKHHKHDGCNLDFSNRPRALSIQKALQLHNSVAKNQNLSGTYNVFPVPAESPLHGDRELLVNPHDTAASPFGWHDTNGQEGAEYTITRGNNVHAYLDEANTNSSQGDEPDGGEALIFDFPFDDQNSEPDTYQEAAVTQLFYMNNYMHDFTHAYGFDEQSGNFQQNNYGNGGSGGDPVAAHAQDGSGFNNANFATPNDGQDGVMQMFLWTSGGGKLLNVIEPEAIAGGYVSGTADFGPAVGNDPVTGTIALAFDASGDPDKACDAIDNVDEVTGKIAMVNRGLCFFEQKAANVEAAGAIALIICNFENEAMGMAGVPEVPDPSIPTISLSSNDCDLIKITMENQDVTATLVLEEQSGPTYLDSDFDNGIIAHEYGHGISNRLTGGRTNSNCLGNGEQMGEGWSDFFTLVTSVKPGDVGTMPRGIGNYATHAAIDGNGIRRKPYSTDPSVNDQTYRDIIGEAQHARGEIWAGALWDMYWLLVDKYGFDEDLIHGTGGNNIAVQLVMDGMKLQGCSPGFISGRDGILAADEINNGGANTCLIWEAFAQRGLGYLADERSTGNGSDGLENFAMLPACADALVLNKSMTALITAGDEITVTLEIANYKAEPVTEVAITDELAEGLTYINGSVSDGVTVTGSTGVLNLEVGDLAAGEVKTITYQLSSNPSLVSQRYFYDDIEAGDDLWGQINLEGIDIWDITDTEANSGDFSWYVPATPRENDQVIQLNDPVLVQGTQPALRFYHQIESEHAFDGGWIEISKDGGFVWERLDTKVLRNPYDGPLSYSSLAIPGIEMYFGESDGFEASYFDLSDYIDEEVIIRFRFGTDDEGNQPEQGGWFVDDIELMDLFNYNGEACASSAQGDQVCTMAPESGTIVDTGEPATNVEEISKAIRLEVFPNPANTLLNVAFQTETIEDVQLELLNAEGQVLKAEAVQTNGGYQIISIQVGDLPGGFYFVRAHTSEQTFVKKVIKQ